MSDDPASRAAALYARGQLPMPNEKSEKPTLTSTKEAILESINKQLNTNNADREKRVEHLTKAYATLCGAEQCEKDMAKQS